MNFDNVKNLFYELSIDITENQYEKFLIYLKELKEWNKKINLTAITNDNDIWIKHFIDSCTIVKYIEHNSSIIDVGTGAGFPSLPARIIRDDIKLTMLDSLNKRIDFLKDITNKLEYNNIEFIHGRAEDAGQNKKYREKFDVVTARAVANLSTLSEYCIPFVKKGGCFICMKAGNVEEEINNAQKAVEELGGTIKKVETFTLPDSDIERTLIVITKIKDTPSIYPRKAGMPSKKPL